MIARSFGAVSVEVNLETGTTTFLVDDPRLGIRRPRMHSLEEIIETHQTMRALAACDPVAADFARALEFAGRIIKQAQEGTS